ncbi:MAG: tRNA (N(6)-L-threonylcarbamoyladenosine(37)-C(2))-methylthiotransferase MtaB [Bacilli bacterium]|nr:tRNA (N(6)-L-threonylcarbamoyladenosine(37)-C(2))-methylthiotransferase MtaB [Bacilli bacterium]
MKKYYLFSLGCKVNSYENHALGTSLSERGYQESNSPEDSDVLILNTCSVTGKADQKSRQHISKLRRANPNACLVVMGCYSQLHAKVAEDLGANIVLGSSKRDQVPSLVEAFLSDPAKTTIIDVKTTVRHEDYDELGVTAFTDAARAYLKIQDGCDNFCSYCLIPTLRGNSRSRKPGEVLKEAQTLVKDGYKEIIITGIHIGGYGKDLGDGSYRLSDLLEDMLEQNPTLCRLRISSIEESEIDDHFLSLLAEYPNIVDHLHIPLQSGSSSVLKRMRRKYDTDAFIEKIKKIRSIRPDIAITTDVIAGFPNETEEEWRETVSICKEIDFAEIHVFPFSSRPGTFAAALKDLDPSIKKRRVHELLELSKKMREAYKARFYGKEMEVLIEDYDEERHISTGHTSNYLLVNLDSSKPLHGQIETVIYNPSIAAD